MSSRAQVWKRTLHSLFNELNKNNKHGRLHHHLVTFLFLTRLTSFSRPSSHHRFPIFVAFINSKPITSQKDVLNVSFIHWTGTNAEDLIRLDVRNSWEFNGSKATDVRKNDSSCLRQQDHLLKELQTNCSYSSSYWHSDFGGKLLYNSSKTITFFAFWHLYEGTRKDTCCAGPSK